MSFFRFLQDKFIYLLFLTGGFVLMLLFVSVYMDQNFAAGIFLSILFAVSLIVPILYDFRKRRRFYQQVTDSFEQLDQKTLLAELITHPDFLEGQILYDIIYKTNK